ncbi:hypothetical protein B0H14DRAFT_2651829 [Mycena olivaceomarginata]|nr:hypothetical protein B0H14DRAFT_2651829 [Mycena olivaceomarginata]
MSTPSTKPLTAAEKRKITLAAKAEQEKREQAAFEAESKKNPSGRKAKVKANEKAVWKLDQSEASRKRTLSETAPAAEVVKKAQGTKDIATVEQPVPAPKVKVSTTGRKYVPATLDDSDNPAPKAAKPRYIDFTKIVPATIKSKSTSTKVKAVVTKGLKALAGVKSRAVKVGKAATKKPRVIAESALEDEEAVSSEENSTDVTKSDQSDGEDVHDVSPNEDEFQSEVPHVVSGKSKVADDEVDNNSDIDVEMKGHHGSESAHELFDSDNESIEIDKPRVKSKDQASRQGSVHEFLESDNESIEIDKPRVKSKGKARRQEKSEPSTDDTFSDAPRRVVFIDDSDSEMPLSVAKSAVSLRSGHSSAVSWSSGQDLCVPDSDAEEDVAPQHCAPTQEGMKGKSVSRKNQAYGGDDMRLHEAIAKSLSTIPDMVIDSKAVDSNRESRPAPKKVRKVSAARQKQDELERPEVRPAPVAAGKLSTGLTTQLDRIAVASVDATLRPESEWHMSACIMFPAPGKDIGLTSQTEELKAVLRGCIEFIKLSLVFEDAYPAIVSRAGFARSYLLSAAQDPAAVHIKHRLETDLSFSACLADIPLDRINITRGDFKCMAAQEVPGLYRFAHLPAAENCLKGELPFHHEAIVSVLKKAVFTGQFQTRNLDLFASTSVNHPDRVELPDAMVCLAATAVYGALVGCRTTGILQNIPFTEGAYEDIYRNQMRTLIDTRATAPVALYRVLHRLYILITESTAATATATGSSSVLINLVEVPESD